MLIRVGFAGSGNDNIIKFPGSKHYKPEPPSAGSPATGSPDNFVQIGSTPSTATPEAQLPTYSSERDQARPSPEEEQALLGVASFLDLYGLSPQWESAWDEQERLEYQLFTQQPQRVIKLLSSYPAFQADGKVENRFVFKDLSQLTVAVYKQGGQNILDEHEAMGEDAVKHKTVLVLEKLLKACTFRSAYKPAPTLAETPVTVEPKTGIIQRIKTLAEQYLFPSQRYDLQALAQLTFFKNPDEGITVEQICQKLRRHPKLNKDFNIEWVGSNQFVIQPRSSSPQSQNVEPQNAPLLVTIAPANSAAQGNKRFEVISPLS